MMKIVCISDTHSLHGNVQVPDGNILICAGDVTNIGDIEDLISFDNWLGHLKHKWKIVISGNHDFCFQNDLARSKKILKNAIYLQDSGCEIKKLKIWGTPWQPEFLNWAFNLPRGNALAKKWELIPKDTDILITHSPPYQILDRLETRTRCEDLGDWDLKNAVEKIKPKLHVFGHIHYSYGKVEKSDTIFVNASVCTEEYDPYNPPIVIDLK